ncbi:MAG: hypothetical protein ACM3MM_10585, partial [Acidobacteriota bacterium]
ALTLLAMPALWLANTSGGSTSPNVAVAGLEVDDGAATAAPTGDPAAAAEAEELDATDAVPPVFLDGPSAAAGASQSQIAVPAKPLVDGIDAKATFRSSVAADTCIVPDLTSGTRIRVVNLDNGRSVTCTSVLAPGNRPGEVVLNTSVFAGIADLTDAPISVEIRR